jgi:hypothetical protein
VNFAKDRNKNRKPEKKKRRKEIRKEKRAAGSLLAQPQKPPQPS